MRPNLCYSQLLHSKHPLLPFCSSSLLLRASICGITALASSPAFQADGLTGVQATGAV